MVGMQGHGIEGVGQQREHRYVAQALDQMHHTEHPKQCEPRDGDTSLQGGSKAECGDRCNHQQDAVVDQQGLTALPSIL